MIKEKLSLKAALVILLLSVVGAFVLLQIQYSLTAREIESLLEGRIDVTVTHQREKERETVSYILTRGREMGDSILYRLEFQDGATVFSLLERLADEEGFSIETTFYEGMGILVESIDGLENGTEGNYWQYWVNEELPNVAADRKEIEGGDVVEWKFEETPF